MVLRLPPEPGRRCRSKEPLYEYACHEGNYALHGILAGARVKEAAGGKVAKNSEEER